MARNFVGNPRPFVFAKGLAPKGPVMPRTLDNASKAEMLNRENHNAAAARDVGGGGIVVRPVKLDDLWTRGRQGVELQQVGGAEWMHIPPHPAAVSLEVFVNTSAGDMDLQNNSVVMQRGFVVTPGGSVRIPKADYVVVRPVAHGSTAYRRAATAAMFQEIDSGGTIAGPAYAAPSDARLFDKTQSFNVLFSREFLAPQEPNFPAALVLPAFGTVSTSKAAVRYGDLSGTRVLLMPWEVAPLEIIRRYSDLALVLTQAPSADGGGGTDVRPATLLGLSTDGILPGWAVGWLDYMTFGARCNAGVGRGARMVLPVEGDVAALATFLTAQGAPGNMSVTPRFSNLSAQWLLTQHRQEFSLDVSTRETAGNGEYTTVYAGPLKTEGKLLVNLIAGTSLELKVYVNPTAEDTTGDLAAIATTPAIPVAQETIATAPGSLALTVPGGGQVAIVALATGTCTFDARLTGR